MKKLVFPILMTLFFAGSISAQVDLKINPIGVLFSSPDISAEFIVSDHIGVEASLGFVYGKSAINDFNFSRSGITAFLMGKYYFGPINRGGDGFNVGIYSKLRDIKYKEVDDTDQINDSYTRNKIAIGLSIGYKLVAEGGFIFGIDAGLGRALNNKFVYDDEANSTFNFNDVPFLNIDAIGHIVIGYRIGAK